jgi:hypothetical protein
MIGAFESVSSRKSEFLFEFPFFERHVAQGFQVTLTVIKINTQESLKLSNSKQWNTLKNNAAQKALSYIIYSDTHFLEPPSLQCHHTLREHVQIPHV